ncbi:MAG: methylenetetrahydrofolate reductase [Armatimonadota bacterium]
MKLTEVIHRRGRAITAEVAPPKGRDASEVLEAATRVSTMVDAVNVTDGQRATMHMSSMALSRLMVERGVEPIWQTTCRDRNRIALQADLLAADALGVDNALVVTGDPVSAGDHPEAKAVFDLDSVRLLQMATQMMDGRDMAGNELEAPLDLCVGAVVAPEGRRTQGQIARLRKKVAAGAQFIQTQAIFDPAAFRRFMQRIDDLGVPVLAGILPITSPGMARFVTGQIPGIDVPPWLIQRLNEAPADEWGRVGAQIAGEIAASVLDCCQGLHIMAQHAQYLVPEILRVAGIHAQ